MVEEVESEKSKQMTFEVLKIMDKKPLHIIVDSYAKSLYLIFRTAVRDGAISEDMSKKFIDTFVECINLYFNGDKDKNTVH